MLNVRRTLEGARFVDLAKEGIYSFDVCYARSDNFLGRPVYEEPAAFLQQEPAQALREASRILSESGAGILVFDAYRPWSVTRLFWDESSEESRKYLANPESGSVHNRGCAIDCGLFDRNTGKPLLMPSGFDEFSERAASDYSGGSPEALRNRELLFRAMREAGFKGIPHEWWHFNHPAASMYPIYDLSFAEIRRGSLSSVG